MQVIWPASHQESTKDWEEDDSGNGCASLNRMGYDKEKLLGSGAMACVHMVVRRSDNKAFAAKRACSLDPEVRELALKEYEILRSLDHPAIVKAQAICEDRRGFWMVMELCEDGSVESYVKSQGPFSEDSGRRLMLQLLEGVDYMHRKRVVHRDIKPANLLLTNHANTLKIADLNCAKQIGQEASDDNIMLTDRFTQLYAAPEHRSGQFWNERVDIWACGLCMFFMLRARLPIDVHGFKVKKTSHRCKTPESQWNDLSCQTRNLVQQCLNIEMRDRPAAMVLLLHPAFGQAELKDGDSFGTHAAVASRVQRSTPFFHTQACGLLSIREEQAANSRIKELLGDRQGPTVDWQERRDSMDALRRLVMKLSDRGENGAEPRLQDAKAVWKARRAARQAHTDCRKFFTTHGATGKGGNNTFECDPAVGLAA